MLRIKKEPIEEEIKEKRIVYVKDLYSGCTPLEKVYPGRWKDFEALLRDEPKTKEDRFTKHAVLQAYAFELAFRSAANVADNQYNEFTKERRIMEENTHRTFAETEKVFADMADKCCSAMGVSEDTETSEAKIFEELTKKYFSSKDSELVKATKESDLEALAETSELQKIIDSVNSSSTVDETSSKSNVVKLSEDVLSRKVGIVTKVVGDPENPHGRNVTFKASVTFDFLRCLDNRTFCLSEQDAFVMARRNATTFAICQTEYGSKEYVVVPLDDFDSTLFDVDVCTVK